ncbi:MAG: hypothetical protein ACI31G_03215 [Bacilli bacterium]
MKKFIKWMDEAPFILKLIFCIPFVDFVWSIYRLVKAFYSKSTATLVIWIVLLIVGIPFIWLIDLILVLLKGKPLYFEL